jgi:hypothetical protein
MLYQELLNQARHLASKEPRKPKEASLRRAVSTAYYGLFHLLIHEACEMLVPKRRSDLRHQLARGFEHRRMKEAAQAAGKNSQATVGLRNVAKTFVLLQEERHEADYSLAKRFRRSEVEALLIQTERAFADWKAARKNSQVKTEDFLLSLLVKPR